MNPRLFKLDFSDALKNAKTQLIAVKEGGMEPFAPFEAVFETTMPPDVHWFGAFLREGEDRFSIHQLNHVPRATWSLRDAATEGLTEIVYAGKADRFGRVDLEFEARHASNPKPPTLDDIAALGRRAHPRLIVGDKGVFDRIKAARATNEVIAATDNHLWRYVDLVMKNKELVFKLDGRRLWSQAVTARTFGLLYAYKFSGEKKYIDRLEKELRAVSKWPTWNEEHFLDCALITFAFAVAYDWLYDDWTPEARDMIAAAIIEKGLKKAGPDDFWIHNGNNWAQVSHACMVAGSIAVADRCPELTQRLIASAVTTFHEPLEFYGPNGGFPEGVGYWLFATTYTVLAIDAFKAAFGTDFGLSADPGFAKSGEFQEIMMGPSGKLFGHSDSGSTRGPLPPIWWYAKTYNRPDLAAGIERELSLKFSDPGTQQGKVGDWDIPGCDHGCEYCYLPLIWMVDVPLVKGSSKIPLAWESRGDVPVVIQSSDRRDGDFFWAGIKGGCSNFSHAHADQGSFVFDAYGERWSIDLGGENYGIGEKRYGMKFWNNATLDSPRWTYLRIGPQGHSVVSIDAENPNHLAYANIVDFKSDGKGSSSCRVDLTDVYPITRKSASRIATMQSAPRCWTLEDRFEGVPIGTEFTWKMNTYADIKIDGKVATLIQNGKTLTLTATDGEWSTFKLDFTDQTPDDKIIQLHLKLKAVAENFSWSVSFR